MGFFAAGAVAWRSEAFSFFEDKSALQALCWNDVYFLS